MSKANGLEDRLTTLFAAELNITVPAAEVDLFETGAMDSLVFVELLLRLEREFNVTVAMEELELDNFRSIARIAAFIAAKQAEQGIGSADPADAESP